MTLTSFVYWYGRQYSIYHWYWGWGSGTELILYWRVWLLKLISREIKTQVSLVQSLWAQRGMFPGGGNSLRVSVLTWAPRRWGGFAGNQITTSAGNLIPAKKFPLFTFLSLPGLRCTTGNWGLMKGRVCPSTTPKAVSSPPDPWPPSTPSLGPEVLPATLHGPGVWKGSKRNREPPTNNSHCGF